MTDQTGGAAAAGEPAPLQPPAPTATLTLTPPEPVAAVATTQAPKLAPAVDAAALPGLDAKVDGYLQTLLDGRREVAGVRDQGERRPHDGRRRHPPRRRDVEPAAPDAGQGARARAASARSKVGATLLELRRTVEDLDPSGATRHRSCSASSRSATSSRDYFRRVRERADAARTRSSRRSTTARTSSARTTPRSTWRSSTSGRRWRGCNQYIYIAERARRAARRRRSPSSRPPTRSARRRCARTSCSTSGRSTRTCSPSSRSRSRATSRSTS